MAVLRVECQEFSDLLVRLKSVIDFDTDLPMNVFLGGGYSFWFFERPLLGFLDLLSEFILKGIESYRSSVYVKFSGRESIQDSCFAFDGGDVDEGVLWLSKKFESFFEGRLGYPIVLCERNCNWIAFESANEEFGVVAVKSPVVPGFFYDFLNANFISKDELADLASSSLVESKIAEALMVSYSQ